MSARMSRGPNLRERSMKAFIRELRPPEPYRRPLGALYRDPATGDEYWITYAKDLILRKASGARVWIAGPWADVPKEQGYDYPASAELVDPSFPEPRQ